MGNLHPEALKALSLVLAPPALALGAAGALGHRVTPEWFVPQSPSLIWPPDRSWFVATEIDFDSTLIGGSAELIAAVLADPKLESWPITATDSLASAADTINR